MTTADAPPVSTRRTAAAGLALAILLTAAAYRHLPQGYFVHDDWDWLDLAAQAQAHPSLLVKRHMDPFNYAVFRPVPLTAFAALYHWAGLEPAPYYLLNLTVHLANVGLLWALGGVFGLGPAGRAVAAAAFGLNWGHREAVLEPHLLETLSCTFFALLTAHGWLRYTARPRAGTWAATAAASLLSLLSQEHGVMLPLALPALAYGATGRLRHVGAAAALWIPMLPVLGIILLGREADPMLAGGVYGFGSHIPGHLLQALAGLALPPLANPEMLHRAGGLAAGIQPAANALTAALGVAAVLLWRRGSPLTRACLLWAVLGALPTTPFVYPPASRYLYFPFVGAALLAGIAVTRAAERGGPARRVAAGACAAWAMANIAFIGISVDRLQARGEMVRHLIRAVRAAVPTPPPGSVIHLLHTPTPEVNLSKQRVRRMFRFFYGSGVTVEERAPDTWPSLPPPGPGRFYVRLDPSGARLMARPDRR